MKLARAKHHVMELDARASVWTAAGNVQPVPTIADDRLSYEVKLEVQSAPPLAEWALILGDAIHNLRSALDVFVWAHADLKRLSENEQRLLMWPVATDEPAWNRAKMTKLKSLPPKVVEAIGDCQPFQRPEDKRLLDGLLLLNRLDIQDKHRMALSCGLELGHIDQEHSIEFENDEAAARNSPPDVTMTSVPPEDGSVLMTHKTVDPIVKVRAKLQLQYRLAVDVGDAEIPVGQLLTGLAHHVAQALEHAGDAVNDEPPTTPATTLS